MPSVHARPALARNTLLNIAGQFVPLAAAVVCIPLIIRGLGAARFGILSLVWIVSSYASIFDLGLGRAATKRVAEALGKGDADTIPRVAWTAALIQLAMGVLGGLVLASLAKVLAEHTLSMPPSLVPQAILSFRVLAVAVPAVLVLSSFRGVLEASQRFDLVNLVKVPLATANFLIPLAGVLLGWGLTEIVAALVLTLFVGAFGYYRVCCAVFPLIRTERHFNRAEFGTLLRFGSWVTVSSVIVPVLVYSDRLLLGALDSVTAVGLYAAPFDMIMRASVIAAGLAATLFPAFSSLRASGQAETYQRIAGQAVKFLLLTVGPIAMIVIPLAPAILGIWLGPTYAVQAAAALRILAVAVLLNCLAYVPYALIQAFDRPDITAKLHLAELPLYLILAGILVSKFGITGAALAWLARVIMDASCLFWSAHRVFHVSLGPALKGRTATALIILLTGGLGLALLSPAHVPPMLQLVIGGGLLIVVPVAFWTLVLGDSERQRLLAVIPILPKRTPVGGAKSESGPDQSPLPR
jgi:O-antigen/teichoic acid export membrane protein